MKTRWPRGLALVVVIGAGALVASACAADDESTFGFELAGAGGVDSGSTGTGGAAGATGASCLEAFCPSHGAGEPCCVTPYGPCGVDVGTGCQGNPTPDF